jgi:rhodanese-related sulfurtransferase
MDLLEKGAQLVDVRPVSDFAAGHIPGALAIELRDAFATWLGWLTDPSRPLVFVRNHDQDPEEIVWQALKIGYEQLAGELDGGMTAWLSARGPTRSIPVLDSAEADPALVLDIRQRSEFTAGHLPGARNAELGEVAARRFSGPVQTMCGHGERAATAASLLAAGGNQEVSIVTGGPGDWSSALAIPLEVGS